MIFFFFFFFFFVIAVHNQSYNMNNFTMHWFMISHSHLGVNCGVQQLDVLLTHMSPLDAGHITLLTKYTMLNIYVVLKVKAKCFSGVKCMQNNVYIVSKHKDLNESNTFCPIMLFVNMSEYSLEYVKHKWKTSV